MNRPGVEIFPLPCVAAEHYMMADNRADYPADMWMCCTFDGVFKRPLFEAALKFALKRHPLFCALVSGSTAGRTSDLTWINAASTTPYIDWGPEGLPLRFPRGEAIDLRSEIGIRFFIRESQNKTKLSVQMHHACSDGLGAAIFLKDLLTCYSVSHPSVQKMLASMGISRFDVSEPLLFNPLKEELLLNRDQIHLKHTSRLSVMSRRILRLLRFFATRCDPIAIPSSTGPETTTHPPGPAYHSQLFTLEETKAISSRAAQEGVPVNDLLVRDLFLAIHQWNVRYDPQGTERSIRIAIPTDLRFLVDRRLPAALLIGVLFVARTPKSFKSPELLLKGIYRETQYLKKWWLGLASNTLVKFLSKISGGIKFFANPKRCHATVIFTNVGECIEGSSLPTQGPLPIGDMFLTMIEGFPQLRPGTYAVFGAALFSGRLVITMRYDKTHLTVSQGRELLDLFVSRIKQSSDPRVNSARNDTLS